MLFHLQQSFAAVAVMEIHCPTPEGCVDILHDLFQWQSRQPSAGHAGEAGFDRFQGLPGWLNIRVKVACTPTLGYSKLEAKEVKAFL
jgi:hypothetical protein